MMKFVFPCKEYEEKAVEYIQEFHVHASKINGTGNLDVFLKNGTYSDWLENVIKTLDIANPPKTTLLHTRIFMFEKMIIK